MTVWDSFYGFGVAYLPDAFSTGVIFSNYLAGAIVIFCSLCLFRPWDPVLFFQNLSYLLPRVTSTDEMDNTTTLIFLKMVLCRSVLIEGLKFDLAHLGHKPRRTF